jgi:transcription antitermination factor NusG
MPWFALYTRPKNEKKVTEQLVKLGIEVYCPLVTQVKQWSDRKKKVETPLISSYVFVNIEEKYRNKVFEAFGVVRYLFWLGKPAVIRDEEIYLLKDSLKEVISTFEISEIKPGDVMNISRGPFQGKEGVVKVVEKNKIQLILKELGFVITLTRE